MRIFLLLLISIFAYGQEQRQVCLEKGNNPIYGYLEYVPACKVELINCDTVKTCPSALLINLDGWGERGNGTTELYKVATAGISRLIKEGIWKRAEFIVVSPQLATGKNMYSAATLHAFVQQMISKYKPDPNKVFMCGLSAGANSIYSYVLTYRDVKACIAISGAGAYSKARYAVGVRLWGWHGTADDRVPFSADQMFYKNYNLAANLDTVKFENARFSPLQGIGHTGWNQIYAGAWTDPKYAENIFDWLLR